MQEIYGRVGCGSTPNCNKELWHVVVWASCYFIWNNRNDRVFSTKLCGGNKIFQEIQMRTFEWVTRRSKKGTLQWDMWVLNPNKCQFSVST